MLIIHFQVVREKVPTDSNNPKGFVNTALNLKSPDVTAVCNPFEIPRSNAITNAAMETAPMPTRLTLGVPFVPTVGCRIDFKNINLTPSKLLAEKLVFSPILVGGPKRSLGSLSEESTMDIGKELDRYQLELENSINEAKLRKNEGVQGHDETKVEIKNTLEVAVEQKITFTQKLEEISEETEEESEVRNEVNHLEIKEVIETKEIIQQKFESFQQQMEFKPICSTLTANEQPCDKITANNNDEPEYASDFEEELDEVDFKAPAPFVRSYRPAATLRVSKESLNSQKSEEKPSEELNKKSKNSVQNMIRNSIRKIMHKSEDSAHKENAEKNNKESHAHHSNLISSIRHSLRRKPTKQLLEEDDSKSVNISIIDTSERTMKLKSADPQIEFAKIEQLTNEKKHTLRNSIRKSTRDVMRSVFHKQQENYTFGK